jgi:hypothetical protein
LITNTDLNSGTVHDTDTDSAGCDARSPSSRSYARETGIRRTRTANRIGMSGTVRAGRSGMTRGTGGEAVLPSLSWSQVPASVRRYRCSARLRRDRSRSRRRIRRDRNLRLGRDSRSRHRLSRCGKLALGREVVRLNRAGEDGERGTGDGGVGT